ncbi:MAG: hypothetical protein HQL83_15780, partial [Magnetococcales bacterium]|nr:hypothetical protein [Magnetococcales bacterium]
TQTVATHTGRVAEQVQVTIHDSSRPILEAVAAHTGQVLERMDHSVQTATNALTQTVATHTGRVAEQIQVTIHDSSRPILEAVAAHTGQVLERMDHSVQTATNALTQTVATHTGRVAEQVQVTIHDSSRPILEAMSANTGQILERMDQSVQTAANALTQTVATHTGRVAEQVQVTIHDSSRPILEAMSANTGQILERMDQSVQTATNALTQTVATHTGRVAEQVQVTIHDSSRPILEAMSANTGQILERMDQSVQGVTQPVLHAIETRAEQVMAQVGDTVRNLEQPLHRTVTTQVDQIAEHMNRVKETLLTEIGQNHHHHLDAMKQGIHTEIAQRESVFDLSPTLDALRHHAEVQHHRIDELEALIRRQRIEESATLKEDLHHIVQTATLALAKRDELGQAIESIKGQNAALTRKQTDLIIAIQEESGHLSHRFQELLEGLRQELTQAMDQNDLSIPLFDAIKKEIKILEHLVQAHRAANRETGLHPEFPALPNPLATNIWNQTPAPPDGAGVERTKRTKIETVIPVVIDNTEAEPLRAHSVVPEPLKPPAMIPDQGVSIVPPVMFPPTETDPIDPAIPWTTGITPGRPRKSLTTALAPMSEVIPWSEKRVDQTAEKTQGPTVKLMAFEDALKSAVRGEKPRPPTTTPPPEPAMANLPDTDEQGVSAEVEPSTPPSRSLNAIIQTGHPLPWATSGQKPRHFASQREASMDLVVNRMAREIRNRSAGKEEPITPILTDMSDLLATGRPISDPRLTHDLSQLVQTIETWFPGPEFTQDPLTGLDDSIMELARLLQDRGGKQTTSDDPPAKVKAVPLQRQTIKPTIPRTPSPFPPEVLATSAQVRPAHTLPPPRPGKEPEEPTERLNSLLNQYYHRGQGD